MSPTGASPATTAHAHPANKAYELLTAVSMTIGRGPAARTTTELAKLTPHDHVVDIGCGPGTAVRVAAHRCAGATGVDPTPLMLRLGRWLTAIRRVPNATFVGGSAEALPLPDSTATVVWALSSLHHWTDRAAGLAEARRVLAPVGRILLVERLVEPGAHGHATHGLTSGQAGQLADDLTAAGFGDVHTQIRRTRQQTLVIVQGTRTLGG